MLKPLLSFLFCATLLVPAVFANQVDPVQECIALIRDFEQPQTSGRAARQLRERRMQICEWADENPKLPLIQYSAGLACLLSEDVVLALPYLESAYEGSGHASTIAQHYALALKIAKKPLEAIKVLTTTVAENPNSPSFKIALAVNSAQVQQYQKALDLLKDFIKPNVKEIRPNEMTSQASLRVQAGTSLLYLGEHGDAIEVLEQANELAPNAVGVLVPLGEAYLKNGQPAEAKPAFDSAYKLYADDSATLYWLGVMSDDKEQAEEYFRKALEVGEQGLKVNSDNGSDHFLLYQICMKLDRPEQAERYKKQAADLYFTHEAPWKDLP